MSWCCLDLDVEREKEALEVEALETVLVEPESEEAASPYGWKNGQG